jgi:hypothetical protein
MASDVKVRFVGINQVSGVVKNVIRDVKGLGGAVSGVAGAMMNFISPGTMGVAAIGMMGKQAVSAYMEEEQAIQDMTAALRLHGDDIDKLLPRYQEFASRIGMAAKMEDELILKQMALARNMGIGTDSLEDFMVAAIGLSARGNKPLEASVDFLTKTFMGNARGLREWKIAAVEGEDAAQRLFRVMEIGRESFSLATDQANTMAGGFTNVKNAWSDMWQGVMKNVGFGGGATATDYLATILRVSPDLTMLGTARGIYKKGFRGFAEDVGERAARGFGMLPAELSGKTGVERIAAMQKEVGVGAVAPRWMSQEEMFSGKMMPHGPSEVSVTNLDEVPMPDVEGED